MPPSAGVLALALLRPLLSCASKPDHVAFDAAPAKVRLLRIGRRFGPAGVIGHVVQVVDDIKKLVATVRLAVSLADGAVVLRSNVRSNDPALVGGTSKSPAE